MAENQDFDDEDEDDESFGGAESVDEDKSPPIKLEDIPERLLGLYLAVPKLADESLNEWEKRLGGIERIVQEMRQLREQKGVQLTQRVPYARNVTAWKIDTDELWRRCDERRLLNYIQHTREKYTSSS